MLQDPSAAGSRERGEGERIHLEVVIASGGERDRLAARMRGSEGFGIEEGGFGFWRKRGRGEGIREDEGRDF
ncbi:hypothetical protein KSP40_PGU021281 [Platanthera guangdongensis]|uniref:Uncharacterized protein n=1 Tax=Platanthera guangdongensis TaxID=2320717 RepID=A0ABR2N041_9ASPA